MTAAAGNEWVDQVVADTLRLLDRMGRTEIPVYSGASYPLVNHGPSYGKTLFWSPEKVPPPGVRKVEVQLELDYERFVETFLELMTVSPYFSEY